MLALDIWHFEASRTLRLDVVALVLVTMFKSKVVTSRLAIQCAPRRHANLRR